MRPVFLALPLALMLPVAAAAADIQEDIRACAAEATEAGLVAATDASSFRFVSDKGNRNRVLTLKVVGPDQTIELDCKMKRRDVVEVVLAEDQTRTAAR
ncbi:hypothetical protein [Parvularcula dongshanensis]|uniref:PepSY domain-containing protein n=1 Tax=Parvularcula dongshanensis TaxID=1173995 RepID=A0A840I4Z7_9PROT|nr:hypothetical protein [Parvularcula dongshanensis]MBB4659248.1 hypothetical protein [Parvularcula dongshanensis]